MQEIHFKVCTYLNRLVFFILLILFCSFNEPNYCKMVDQIVDKYIKEFTKPRDLQVTAYGGAMMNDVKTINLHLTSFTVNNIIEARKLYVQLMEELLCRINKNKIIRPYLHNFPFEIKNIELAVMFKKPENKTIVDDGNVAFMYLIPEKNMIFYRGYDSEVGDGSYYSLKEESYADAVKMVNQEM